MSPDNNGLAKTSLVSIRLINHTTNSDLLLEHQSSHNSYSLDLNHYSFSTFSSLPSLNSNYTNFSVPYSNKDPVDRQAAINMTNKSSWWQPQAINSDVVIAFALIVFYTIFVLFIFVIIIKIVVTIFTTGHMSFKLATSSDSYSDGIDQETSSRTRGISYQSQSQKNHPYYQREMTSFAIDRTNSPSIIDEDEDEES